jgi:hypothetical protein
LITTGLSANRTSCPHGNRHRTRHLLNQEFMQALLLHFRQHGKKAIEKVAREQPASYLKILGLYTFLAQSGREAAVLHGWRRDQAPTSALDDAPSFPRDASA